MEFPIPAVEWRKALGTCPRKLSQCEARLTAASHISHSSRHVLQSPRNFAHPPRAPIPTRPNSELERFRLPKRDVLIKSLLLSSDTLLARIRHILIAAFSYFRDCDTISDNQPGAHSHLFPHLDESCTPIRRLFPLLPSRTTHYLTLEHLQQMQSPRKRLTQFSCMQRQLSKVQICDLIPFPPSSLATLAPTF